MHIFKITSGLNFKSGKVHLFSDFDGTYLPANHSSLYNPEENEQLGLYSNKMKDFFEKTEGDLFFNISTGRTFGEYEVVSELIRKNGFKLPLPQTFIAKNGSDKYLKNGTDEAFYAGGKFPFSYQLTDKVKEEQLLKSHGWDGAKIKDFIANLAKEMNISIVEADSENSVKDYGERSLFHEKNLGYDEWQKLPRENDRFIPHDKPVIDAKIGSRKDGNLKFHLIFSPDYGPCAERNGLYDNFMNRIKAFLAQEKVKYNMQWDPANSANFYRNSCTITPDIDGGQLTKVYDTKQALQKAMEEDDIVIVSGDGLNDFEMLNPLEYIDKEFWQECENKSENKVFYRSEMFKKLKDLAKVLNENFDSPYIVSLARELKENGFLKKLEELPLYSIVIKSQKNDLADLVAAFEKTGKVIEVKPANIDAGIKKAINNHTGKSQKFKEKMSEKLKTVLKDNIEIPSVLDNIPEIPLEDLLEETKIKDEEMLEAKYNKMSWVFAAVVGALILAIKCCTKAIKHNNENKNSKSETSFVKTA